MKPVKEAAGRLQFSRPCLQDKWAHNSGNRGQNKTLSVTRKWQEKEGWAISYRHFRQKLYIQILTNEVFTADWGGQTGGLVRVLWTPRWVMSLWMAPQSLKRQLDHSTVTAAMDMCMTGHWPVQCWTAKHTLKSQWTPAKNSRAQKSGRDWYTAM